jgi:hypothetical protein
MSSGGCAEERRAQGFVPLFTALTNSEIFELTAVPARLDQSGLWPALVMTARRKLPTASSYGPLHGVNGIREASAVRQHALWCGRGRNLIHEPGLLTYFAGERSAHDHSIKYAPYPGRPRCTHLSPVTPDEDVRTILINRVSWGAVRTCASPPPWAKRWRQKIRHSATPRP